MILNTTSKLLIRRFKSYTKNNFKKKAYYTIDDYRALIAHILIKDTRKDCKFTSHLHHRTGNPKVGVCT